VEIKDSNPVQLTSGVVSAAADTHTASIRIARVLRTLIRSLIKSLVSATATTVGYHGCRVPRVAEDRLERRPAADWPNQPLINCGIESAEDRPTDARRRHRRDCHP